MKKLITLSCAAAIVSISAFASQALIEKARSAGLKPISYKTIKELDTKENPLTPAKIKLGQMLYFEPRLSKSGLISCNTCHNLGLGGADGVPVAIGHKWTANPHHLNSPTVYNAVLANAQFWDGRSPHLEDQAKGPMVAPPEMAIDPKIAEERLKSIPTYVELFKKAFPQEKEPITFDNIAKAIGAFERTLITPSRFDAFLRGKTNALTKEEKEGLALFIDKGCTSCHTGQALGGTMQPFPAVKPYPYAHVGDFKGDKDGRVKVPTLRNITETAPYFHNGAIWTLAEAIKTMGSTQLGIEISDAEAAKISTFLGSLTGKKPAIIYPILPASTLSTPKPDAN
ncbi:MAG: cytochrome-c peroxidase [Campylobacterales bacterium]